MNDSPETPVPQTQADEPPSPSAATIEGLYCPDCAYDLRGIDSERCPECGLDVTVLRAGGAGIPWESRREMGSLRAYWKTVRLAVFRPGRLARAVHRSVGYGDAQVFRWVTIAHAYGPILLWLGMLWAVWPGEVREAIDDYGWPAIAVALACGLASFAVVTGLPSYFFHPRAVPVGLQNRMVAVSYYACAGLALSPLVLIPGGMALYAQVMRGDDIYWFKIAAVVAIVLFVVYWVSAVGLARHLLRGPVAVARVALALPVLWGLAFGLIVFVLPAAIVYPFVIIFSLF